MDGCAGRRQNRIFEGLLGSYDFIDLSWTVPGIRTPVITAFDLYQERPFLIFVQRFPNGFKSYASGDWTVPSVAFPQFVLAELGNTAESVFLDQRRDVDSQTDLWGRL